MFTRTASPKNASLFSTNKPQTTVPESICFAPPPLHNQGSSAALSFPPKNQSLLSESRRLLSTRCRRLPRTPYDHSPEPRTCSSTTTNDVRAKARCACWNSGSNRAWVCRAARAKCALDPVTCPIVDSTAPLPCQDCVCVLSRPHRLPPKL